MSLSKRYKDLKDSLPESTTLVAVSKYANFDQIEALYQLGHRDFGENRVDQLLERSLLARERGLNQIRWHFIGHLQSNKVKRLVGVPELYAIHSVDSLKLLIELEKRQEALVAPIEIYLEVKTSQEDSKSGLTSVEELKVCLDWFQTPRPSLQLVGLMTMAAHRPNDQYSAARESFKGLRELRDHYGPDLKLSMGMSGDYLVALEYGSTLIRVGSLIFEGTPEK